MTVRATLLLSTVLVVAAATSGHAGQGSCGLIERTAPGQAFRSGAFDSRTVAMYGDSIGFETRALIRQTSPRRVSFDVVAGRTIGEALDTIRADMRRHVPRYVVMELGTNDVIQGATSLRTLAKRVRAIVPQKARILWITPYVEGHHWYQATRSLAGISGIALIRWDAANYKARVGGRSPLVRDGVHPSCSGGKRFASMLGSAIGE